MMTTIRLHLGSLPDPGGARVAVVDSGVHAAHPHVQGVSAGIGIDGEGREHADFVDRLGHGTAVAAAIREKAPRAEREARAFGATSARQLIGTYDVSSGCRRDGGFEQLERDPLGGVGSPTPW